MRNDANYIRPRNQHFIMNKSKFSIDHRTTNIGDTNLKCVVSASRVIQTNIKNHIHAGPSVTSIQSEKIYYNPNFLSQTQIPNSSNNARNIHVNPNFVKPPPLPSESVIKLCKPNEQSNGQNNVHVNPKFLERKKSNNPPCLTPAVSYSSANTSSHFKISKYSLDKRPVSSVNLPLTSKEQFPVRKPELSQCVSKEVQPFRRPVLLNSFVKKQPIVKKQVSPVSKHRVPLSSKYKKVNMVNSQSSPCVKVVKSKYSIRRVLRKPITPCKPFVNLTPGSYKKIGKRKLIRKSLLQKYISTRRFSTSYSYYKMRNIAQKKVARAQSTPFKSLPRHEMRTKYKIVARNPSKYSKDNRVTHLQNSEFLKIGKRKIVRKSIISSIIEARRKASISYKSKLVSRYKIRKISRTLHQHRENKRVLHTRKNATRWNSQPVQLTKMSRSVMFRMRPNVRLRVKMEVKKLALLKKNNSKCSFYNRFGYCKGKDNGSCKKVHDPKSISVCKKYLLGECTNDGCKLNHTKSKEKMPTCHQFLAGVCVRDNCPFLHVKLHAASSICREFLGGYCPNGNSCSKRHIFMCPDWEAGKCLRKVCPYPHPKKLQLPKRQRRLSAKLKPTQKKQLLIEANSDATDRYFDGAEHGLIEIEVLNDSQENNEESQQNPAEEQKKSVYEDESLLSFIPFSTC